MRVRLKPRREAGQNIEIMGVSSDQREHRKESQCLAFVPIMVNTHHRSPPESAHPSDAERKILGPCHDLPKLQAMLRVKKHKGVHIATENASRELGQYCMDEVDLVDIVLDLKSGNYHDSEWCKFSALSPWFAADTYRIRKAEKLPGEKDICYLNYYLKFSVNKLGSMLLFFSVHRDIL